MSDDTPTRRFPVSDDTPTERFGFAQDAATESITPDDLPPTPGAAPGPLGDGGSKRTFIILAVIGAALIAGLIAVLVIVASNRAVPVAISTPPLSAPATPGDESTPSEAPSEVSSPTATPPPVVPTGPSITAFTIDETSVKCKGGGAKNPDVDIEWSTSNVDRVFFGIDTADASEARSSATCRRAATHLISRMATTRSPTAARRPVIRTPSQPSVPADRR